MGNIVDGIQRPLRVCLVIFVGAYYNLGHLVNSGDVKIHLYSTRHQYFGVRPLTKMEFYSCQLESRAYYANVI